MLIDRAADFGLPAKPAGFAPGVPGRHARPAHRAGPRQSDASIDAKVRSYA